MIASGRGDRPPEAADVIADATLRLGSYLLEIGQREAALRTLDELDERLTDPPNSCSAGAALSGRIRRGTIIRELKSPQEDIGIWRSALDDLASLPREDGAALALTAQTFISRPGGLGGHGWSGRSDGDGAVQANGRGGPSLDRRCHAFAGLGETRKSGAAAGRSSHQTPARVPSLGDVTPARASPRAVSARRAPGERLEARRLRRGQWG